MKKARHRKEDEPCNEFCEFARTHKVAAETVEEMGHEKSKVQRRILFFDYVLGLNFWLFLPVYLVSIAKLSYMIPQLFSNAGVIRYVYRVSPSGTLTNTKAMEYKNSIQFEILKDILVLDTVICGVYPFLLLLFLILALKVVSFIRLGHIIGKQTNSNWNRLSSQTVYTVAIKALTLSLAILGLLITTFSIWGSW